jgi:fructose-1,6-bisphosphatase I
MESFSLQTVQQHILEEQRRYYPQASGEFSWLLSGVTLATKMVAAQVRRAGLVGVLGATGDQNVQGETVQKLDVAANKALLHCLGNRGNVAIMASEENEEPVVVERDREHGKYVVIFDPLDGSSNIDVNVSTGTIFTFARLDPGGRAICWPTLQRATEKAAGYVVYGPRPCSSTPPATACTVLRSSRRSGRT